METGASTSVNTRGDNKDDRRVGFQPKLGPKLLGPIDEKRLKFDVYSGSLPDNVKVL